MAPRRYDPDLHHRRSMRLKAHDYTHPSAYFVTICTYQRECILGEIVDEEMRLNSFGEAVKDKWLQTTAIRTNVTLDAFIVMPNHVHGIVVIDERRGVLQYAPTTSAREPMLHSPSQTVGALIRGFKSAATHRVNALRDAPGTPVWQRNYYEHVIRDEVELQRVRAYIVTNPVQWPADVHNPMGPPGPATATAPWQV